MPDRVQLAAHNLIKAAKEALLKGEVARVNLVRAPQVLYAHVQEIGDAVIYGHHWRCHLLSQLYHLQGFTEDLSDCRDLNEVTGA